MKRRNLGARLEALEDARRKEEAGRVRVSDVLDMLGVVLSVVQEEAGQDTFERVAGRIVGQKAARVASLSEGRP